MPKKPTTKSIETLTHEDATRKNIPTAEYQSVMRKEEQNPIQVAYEQRNRDLDPQLVWRGKDLQDWSDLVVHAPPLYVQEKIKPKALIDDLLRQSSADQKAGDEQIDLFADFDGIPEGVDKTEFYQHDGKWQNRMILSDSLYVMASLTEREGLRGKVQCVYLDPPYGIKFNSNFQWSTTSRDVKDGNVDHITREPEQVKAFRDTWRDGIHSYLTYLRDRLTVARELLTDSGSIFVQIGDENVHRVRAVMDEVFGDGNFVSQITIEKTSGSTEIYLSNVSDTLLWYCRHYDALKYRKFMLRKVAGGNGGEAYTFIETRLGKRIRINGAEQDIILDGRIFRLSDMTSQSVGRTKGDGAASWFGVDICGRTIKPTDRVRWKTNEVGMSHLIKANRIEPGKNTLNYVRYLDDFPAMPVTNVWSDVGSSVGSDKVYVVQTNAKVIERCLLMSTDPGDLVLDPTCGSGTTAYVAEQWGRRWITIDTSRVALALARTRIMGARYPYYLLADSRAGQLKEAEITRAGLSNQPTRNDIRQGFVYERVPHITLKSIANNAEIDVIWEKFQKMLEPLREQLNVVLGRTLTPNPSPACGRGEKAWQEWKIPRETDPHWPDAAKKLHGEWWKQRAVKL